MRYSVLPPAATGYTAICPFAARALQYDADHAERTIAISRLHRDFAVTVDAVTGQPQSSIRVQNALALMMGYGDGKTSALIDMRDPLHATHRHADTAGRRVAAGASADVQLGFLTNRINTSWRTPGRDAGHGAMQIGEPDDQCELQFFEKGPRVGNELLLLAAATRALEETRRLRGQDRTEILECTIDPWGHVGVEGRRHALAKLCRICDFDKTVGSTERYAPICVEHA